MAEILIINMPVCEVGMTCEEYTMLVVAGPPGKDLPPTVRIRKKQHYNACTYHRGKEFLRYVLRTRAFVTKDFKKEAEMIIKKYS